MSANLNMPSSSNYNDFDSLTLGNTPLDFIPSSNAKSVAQPITRDSTLPQQMILDFYFKNNSQKVEIVNDYMITEADVKELLSNAEINLINSKVFSPSTQTDYLKSHPLPSVSSTEFNHYLNFFDSQDLQSLEEHISNLNPSMDLRQNIGPFCSLDHLIELSFKFDSLFYKQMIQKRQCMENYIFKWRKVKGDGNCFYRAIIFSFLEGIILNNNLQLAMNLIIDIKNCYETKLIQSKLKIKHDNTIKYHTMLKILMIIYLNLKQGNITKAYEILCKCMITCSHFDFGLILYLRYLLYKYTIDNETKLYTKDFPVLIGNLLPSEYETKEGKFLFGNFYENYLLKMFKDAEKIVIYLIPFVLCTQLNIVLFDVDQDSLKEFHYYGEQNWNSDYFINLVNIKVHYEMVYPRIAYDLFRSYYENYQLSKQYVNVVLPVQEDKNKFANKISVRDIDMKKSNFNLFDCNPNDIDIQKPPNSVRYNNTNSYNIDNYNQTLQFDQINQTLSLPKEEEEKIKHSLSVFLNETSNSHMGVSNSSNNIPPILNNSFENKAYPIVKNNSRDHPNNYQEENAQHNASMFDFFVSSNVQKKSNSNSIAVNNFNNNNAFTLKDSNSNVSSHELAKGIIQNVDFSKCKICDSLYSSQNKYSMCIKCFSSEIKSNLLSLYYLYLSSSKQSSVITKSSENSNKIFRATFIERPITIKEHHTLLKDALALINKDRQDTISLDDLLRELKTTLCAYCETSINMPQFITIPCGCCFCSIKCLLQFFEQFPMIINTKQKKEFICICNHTYSPKELVSFITQMSIYSKTTIEVFAKLFQKKIESLCLFCEQTLTNDGFIKLDCIDLPLQIQISLGITVISHSICGNCFNGIRSTGKNHFYCSLCGLMHRACQKNDDCLIY